MNHEIYAAQQRQQMQGANVSGAASAHGRRTAENPLGLTGIQSAMGRLRSSEELLAKRLDELSERLECVLNPETLGHGLANDPSGGVATLQAEIEDVARRMELRAAGIDMLLRRLAL